MNRIGTAFGPHTKFACVRVGVPASWICPLCGTPKADFDMIEL